MTHASPHRLILASAGTGKTYQLTTRYLALLFAGVAPERILATTFTRKAAGEIQDRVLRRLAEAAEQDEERARLGTALGRELGADEVRARLVALVRSLDRFRIRTLDAFFVQLARLFALDLGLPPDWTIVEDAADEALRRDALGRALETSDRDELLGILRDLQQGDGSRSVERVLLQKVQQGRDAFLDSHAAAWHTLVVPTGLSKEEVDAAQAGIERLPLGLKKDGQPRAHWTNARHQLEESVAARDWGAFLANGVVKKILKGEPLFDRTPIDPEWNALVDTLLQEVRHRVLFEVDAQNRAAHRWLERFENAYEELEREERAYRFEDLPKALHPRQENRIGDQDLVWYRLDGRIDHVLLDEFQDTSPVQWRLLRNLVGEILADGTGERSFFCVGDVKQSIYGWRDAEPRLLDEMHVMHPVLLPEPMSRNHRSSRVVLDTVARVFSGVGENAALVDREARRRAALAFQASFAAPAAARELPGAAWLVMAPPPDAALEGGEDGDEELDGDAAQGAQGPVLQLAARRTRAMLDEAPLATIGILLRRNTWVPRLILLLREQGVRASGEGGNPLVDSAAVLHMVSLLHLADHPGDTAAAFHVATSPLGPSVGLTSDAFGKPWVEEPASVRGRLAEVAAAVRKRLAVEGYGPFCASFAGVVGASYGSWDRKRFDQLVDLAHAFEDQADLRADRFVDHVRLTPVEDPSATQVKVMTVHASKGLEFDAVVLPELDGPFEPHRSALVTRRRDPAGLFDAVSHTRSSALAELDPDGLGALAASHEERTTREVLCLLYVALTRARHRLDMLVQHRDDAAQARKSFAGILRSALGAPARADENGVLWQHAENDDPWYPPTLTRPAADAAIAAARPPRFRDEPAPSLVRRTPSAQEGAGRLDPRDLLRSPSSQTRMRGRLVHRWMQAIEWLEDFAASDEELTAIGRQISADGALVARTLRELRAALAGASTRALLSRGVRAERGPRDAERTVRAVWRERPFSVLLSGTSGGEELWSGAFDRVVLEEQAGALVAAELVDFKTDRVEPDDLAERVAFYRPQLEGYRRVLAHMTGLPADAIRARLAFVHADAVIEV